MNENKNEEINNTNVEPVVSQESTPVVENAESPVQAPVTDQTVIQNIAGQNQVEVGEVQNIVNNSETEVPKAESKPEDKNTVVYKNPSKLSTVLVIILFILLFVFIFEMPKINEWLESRKQDAQVDEIERQAKQIEEAQKKKEEEAKKKQEQQQKEEQEKLAQIQTLKCSLSVPATEEITYSKNVVETFDYNGNNQVVSSSQTTTYTFTAQDDTYLKLKTDCETNSTKYLEHAGYTMTCTSDDLSVSIGNKFDLSTYKTIDDGTNKIPANAVYNEKIEDISLIHYKGS